MIDARVSVALCTHNGGAYIEQQIRSILMQTPAPAEVVLSDDASSDNTIAIAERVAREVAALHGVATDLVILRNSTSLGVTANFEQAVTASRGDVIALSDQDDVWHPGKLARLLDVFEARPSVVVVASDARLVDADGEPLGYSLFDAVEVTKRDVELLNGSDAFAVLMRRNVMTGATMALRRVVLDVALPFPASWVHDEWIAVMGAGMGEVAMVAEELIDYRQHGSNQIGALRIPLGDKLRRLVEPRGDRNARLLSRAESLAERVERASGLLAEGVTDVAAAKLAHERARSSLPAARWRRVFPVATAAVAGRYARYGRGSIDIVRDLSQPSH